MIFLVLLKNNNIVKSLQSHMFIDFFPIARATGDLGSTK